MCAKILNQLINLASLLALLLTSSPLVMSDGHQKVEEKKSKEDKNNKENPVILDEIEVIADRAMDRKTPITFSDVSKEELNTKLGSRDIPLLLNTTPGIYATGQGGGAGDSRINIRGFDQRNTAVMINGVPVNDMENGWVYWSNWDGLGDVTSSIQVQRGLGASKLAISSVGGTLNVITDAAAQKTGLKLKTEYGSGNFLKGTVIANTGLINNQFAASLALVRKVGDGLVEKTWTHAYAYYGAFSYQVNDDHKFELFAIGAPQMHGQRSYKEGIWQFDYETAQDEGIKSKPDQVFGYKGRSQDNDVDDAEENILYSSNWGPVSESVLPNGEIEEYYALWTPDGSTKTRSVSDFADDDAYIMERQNFYHKPQINLNWTGRINDSLTLTNVLYYSQGIGGGSGPYGDGLYKYGTDDFGNINFDAVYTKNSNNIVKGGPSGLAESFTIIRNSVNQHTWIGDILTATYKFSDKLTGTGGIDWRTYTGEHWREVRNLLGGDYFVNTSDKNQTSKYKQLGDKVAYHNDGKVNWLGLFGQANLALDDLSIFGSGSISLTNYERIDYFLKRSNPDEPMTATADAIPGFTAKGGANYNLSENLNVYGISGFLSKAPNFDGVFHYDNSLYENITNEKVITTDIGIGYTQSKILVNANAYLTTWLDRTWPTSARFPSADGQEETYRYLLQGLNATHLGIELEGMGQLHEMLDVGAMLSIGNYTWGNNVEAEFAPEDLSVAPEKTELFIKGLKVGNIPQITGSLMATVKPVSGAYINFVFKTFMEHYAEFNPADRTDPADLDEDGDNKQSYKLPNYSLLDLHFGYRLAEMSGVAVSLNGHVFNLLDAKYISDADDNDRYSAFDDELMNHDAASAGVYFGLPRRFNLSLTIEY